MDSPQRKTNMISIPLNEIWIVAARCGRFNGSAYVRARSKKEANVAAQNGGWLQDGRVIKSETKLLMDWYKENEGVTDVAALYGNYLSDVDINAINALEDGDYNEIEWGT